MSEPELSVIQSLLNTGGLAEAQTGTLEFSAGSRIFEEGDVADCAYMIDSGYVEISRHGNGKRNVLATLGPGEIIGEMALLDGLTRSAAASALHETRLVLISRQQLLDAVEHAGPLAKLMLVAAIKRLRVSQLSDSANGGTHDTSADLDTRFSPYYAATRHRASNEVRLRVELEAAIREQQLDLVYQPIVALADGRAAGFEALVRWPRADKKVVGPAEFIPLAEKVGLIMPLGLWVLERAFQAMAIFDRRVGKRASSDQGVFMSVNVSPRQLESEESVEEIARTIEQADVDPARVKLEITEHALIDDPRMAMLSLARLKSTGATIAIDDFGTGYSSLSYLHRFPLDTLKIDRSFVTGVAHDASRQRVVAAIISLAHGLGLDVVAEGIEDRSELIWLQAHGCQFGQGYFVARPSPVSTAAACLRQHFEW